MLVIIPGKQSYDDIPKLINAASKGTGVADAMYHE